MNADLVREKLKETAVKTPRLILRRFTTDDLDDFLGYQSDPIVRRHLLGSPMTAAQAADYLTTQSVLDNGALDSWHALAVHHVADDRVIGDVGIWLPANPRATPDIGFQFHPAYHGGRRPVVYSRHSPTRTAASKRSSSVNPTAPSTAISTG
ncbi:GNAT family N-acetyltransferase [Actinoplanes sp. LDG1-06]|uniref:GNAT family N-acetyltransferase n=1 Tax=Paractinoplanes ovalisporus TaxID=2810368 RepID=A0ABS2AKT4_9ACTN|nr:GNAT family N-acetyltransferase [Actinoplanes ovalisporus]MBM2620474.1 GNAT family N-acetyltransferase [Actinoplanes ovalisporus]